MILYTAELRSQHCGMNLAFEEAFLLKEKFPQSLYLFFYENTDALVLGKSLNLKDEVYPHKGPTVFRRISGGGTVLHTKGNLNYALFLSLTDFPEFMNVTSSYQKILAALSNAFARPVLHRGLSDLAIYCRGEEKKFSGNAQCRKRGWLLHHGTLLYRKEALRRIPYYLKPPPKEPDYRRGRKHRDFMASVLPCYNRYELMRRIRLAFAHSLGAELRSLPEAQLAAWECNLPFQPERRAK